MGFSSKIGKISAPITSVIDQITGGQQAADAAREAAAIQGRLGREGIAFQKEQSGLARQDLAPFRELGERNIAGLESLVTDPTAQLKFVQDNPFFQSLANQATQTLMQNQATTGKLGSGGTAEALQNSLLLLGTDLVNQNIGQRQNLVNLGSNAASGQANIAQQLGGSVRTGLENIGNVQAAGLIGGANAIQQGRQSFLNLGGQVGGAAAGGAIAACDERLKTDIQKVGNLDNGLPLYMFKYKDDPTEKLYINVMAQDVEKVNPEAVQEIEGFKYVNMNKIWH